MTEQEIFLAAIDLPAAARAAYLDGACGGNPALRTRIEALLRSHDAAGSFLGSPAVAPAGPDTTSAQAPGAEPEGGSTRSYDNRVAPDDDTDDDLTFLAPPTRPGSLGRIGHYEVLQVLGRGGFGVVFRAFDDVLQRVVAVKVLSPSLAVTSPSRKRFLREARSAAQVRHEAVVQIYAVEENPLPHLVMEFVPGETLQQRLNRTGPLDVAEVLLIGRQVAEGLAAAHDRGLVHRDIKPGNILIEGGVQPRVKLTDFGLARAADDASLTRSGVVAGTPLYMAPEQARGDPLDHRADLFSLGSVLYAMLSGRPPFRAGNTLAVLKRVAEDTPRPIREVIPEVPQWLCDVVARLHAKSPADRFASAREVADLLGGRGAEERPPDRVAPPAPAVADGPTVPSGPSDRLPGRAGRSRRRPVLAVGIAALALVAVGAYLTRPVLRALANEGELVVEVDDPAIEVRVRQGASEIVRRENGRTYVVRAGEDGLVEFTIPGSGFPGFSKPFRIGRGGTAVVSASRQELADARPPRPAKSDVREAPVGDQPAPVSLSPEALVARPAAISGLGGWTVETVGHRGPVQALAYHKDGRLLAALGDDSTVRVWDTATGRLARALVGLHFHQAPVGSPTVAWSPDGARLAAVTADGSAAVWEYATGKRALTPGEGVWVSSVTWTAEGKLLALGFREKNPEGNWTRSEVWEVETGRTVRPLMNTQFRDFVRWSPDGKWVCVRGGNSVDSLIPFDPDRPIVALEGSDCAAFSADGKWLLFAQGPHVRMGVLKRWDLTAGKVDRVVAEKVGVVGLLDWAPRGPRLFYRKNNQFLTLLDTDTGTDTLRLSGDAEGVAWSPDGNMLALSEWGTVRLVSALNGVTTLTIGGHLGLAPLGWPGIGHLAALSPDRTHLVQTVCRGTSARSDVHVWDTVTHRPVRKTSTGDHVACLA